MDNLESINNTLSGVNRAELLVKMNDHIFEDSNQIREESCFEEYFRRKFRCIMLYSLFGLYIMLIIIFKISDKTVNNLIDKLTTQLNDSELFIDQKNKMSQNHSNYL